MNKQHYCPLCKQSISHQVYLDILHQKESDRNHREQDIAEARNDGILSERKHSQKTARTIDIAVDTLRNAVDLGMASSSPQNIGFWNEDELIDLLKPAFPDDSILKKGKSVGDIHHIIYDNGIEMGLIMYESKYSSSPHDSVKIRDIQQAYKEKQRCNADIAILVTNRERKGFNAFTRINDICLVKPFCLIDIVTILRQMLILSKSAHNTNNIHLDQILNTLPNLNKYLNDIINRQTNDHDQLTKEISSHCNGWQQRIENLHYIKYNGINLMDTIQSIIEGKLPAIQEIPSPPNNVITDIVSRIKADKLTAPKIKGLLST
jgi:hypothetical protein